MRGAVGKQLEENSPDEATELSGGKLDGALEELKRRNEILASLETCKSHSLDRIYTRFVSR